MARKTESKEKKKIKREFSAGGVVFRKYPVSESRYTIKWLVTKSAPSKDYPLEFWRLPKGWLDEVNNGLEPGDLASGSKKATEEEKRTAALREVEEEGGVKAKIVFKLPTQRFFFKTNGELALKFVTYYLMEYIEDCKNGFGMETDEISWLEYEEARKKLKHKGEKKILDLAKEVFDKGIQPSLI